MLAIRIILADDHPLIRAGIRRFLEAQPDLNIVAEASNGEEALRLVRELEPDVLVLDMEMPNLDGLDVAQRIRAEGLPVRILALSAYDDAAYVSGLWETGAAGYITKEKPPSLIIEAIRAVARGEGRWFVAPANQLDSVDRLNISERELEVLQLIAKGYSNNRIGEELFISENTVKNHVRSLYAKLDISSARELVAWAWQQGLVKSR